MKVLYSGFIDPSHSSYGGYHKILDFPTEHRDLLSENYLFGNWDKKYHLRKIPFWMLDFHTRILRYKYDITHLFYGEITQFPFLPYEKSSKHKTVITLHLDIEKQRFHKYFIKNLSYFDGIIVLSTQQQKYYKEKYNIDTTFIPHGFDTPEFTYIKPKDVKGNSINPEKINLITSGKNYRDFDTLEKSIQKSIDLDRLHFHIVGAPKNIKDRLSVFKSNVSVYNRITDDEYYSLIKSCDYNFLPLTFATANNALLEAQALGVRSILPDISGISDYAAPKPLNLYYSDFDDLLVILNSIDKSGCEKEIVEFSKEFNWIKIYGKMSQFYENL